MDAAIQLRRLTLRHGGGFLLREADYEFHEGLIHGIYAPQEGAGRAFLSVLAGLSRPKSGKVFVDYQEVGVEIDFPEALGMMVGRDGLIGSFTALENLMNLVRINKSVTDRDCLKLIKALGLGGLLKKRVARYDPEMRERVFFAQAVLEGPLFLLLEDPFSRQGEEGRALMRSLLIQSKAQGATILITSPRREDLEDIADTLALLEEERITQVKEDADGTDYQCAESYENL